MPSKLTVALMRPYNVAEALEGGTVTTADRLYLAHVETDDCLEAIRLAREEVVAADTRDLKDLDLIAFLEPTSYAVLFVAEGHINPVFWGWQL